jgi:hypothetical protein
MARLAGDTSGASWHAGAARAEVFFMIAIPVPGWVALILAVLGIIFWTYDLLVLKPKRRRERLARKRML